jgi:hypothetical protein
VEIVAAAYFAYLTGIAVVRRRSRPAVLSLAVLAALFTIGMPSVMPLVYLLAGYWLPAMLVREPSGLLERRLLGVDYALFGANGLERFERGAPRILIEYLELAYLLCYAVVPAGFALLILAGYGDATLDRFWSVVLLASFICYGLLPWLPSRAPRAIEPPSRARRSSIRRLNLAVLDRASVQWNTFPSGHTAASLATALAVGAHMPMAGVVLGVVALSIAVGSVVGRYHYAADAIVAAAVAVLVFVMAIAARGL